MSAVRAGPARRLPAVAIGASTIGALLCAIGAVVDPRRTAAAYLVAYVACVSVVLGALALVMIARVTAATWFVVLRRQAEQVAAVLPALAVLFIPVIVGVRVLYPWAATDGGAQQSAAVRAAIAGKAAYLNVPFFAVRAVIFWAVWVALGELLRRASLAEDRGESAALERRTYILSALGLPAFALTMSFASFDWMMSLTPAWYSTIYGVDYFAGGMVGGLALLALLIVRGRRRGELPGAVGSEHMHALAKLLLTFVLFWVYIGFSQFIVIWSAEIPAETTWYIARTHSGWWTLGVVLIAGHFALPFCALLIRAVKRSIVTMAALGGFLLVMHYLDIYWIVMPDAAPRGASYWLDAGALLFVAGVSSLSWAARRTGEPPVPAGDAALVSSLEYRTN
jgi:ABC-type multidrug transport system fused ATPase/permease subunit